MIEFLPQLAIYYPALVALTILCVAVLVQGILAGAIGLGKSDEKPGEPLKGSHSDFSFRTLRTYANSVENLPVLGVAVILAIIVGVGPGWVNWLVAIHVVLRLLYWAVYYSGIGKIGGGLRTMVYASGLLTNLVLAVVTLFVLLV